MYDLDGGGGGPAAWAHEERNAAWIGWLRSHAPGAVLVDVAAGDGVLALAAARLGAARVYACAADPDLRALLRANALEGVVVLGEPPPGLEPDAAICAELGSEPLRALDALRPYRRPVPRRIRFFAALTEPGPLTQEMAAARGELARIGGAWSLDLGPVRAALDAAEPYRWFTASEGLCGPPTEIWDLAPGERPAARAAVLRCDGERAGGVAIWWEAELDGEHSLGAAPDRGPPVPPLVLSWADAVHGPAIRLRFGARAGRIAVRLA